MHQVDQFEKDMPAIIRRAFKKTWELRQNGEFRFTSTSPKYNSNRSAKFVSEIAAGIDRALNKSSDVPAFLVNSQWVNDDGQRTSGEWLLDIAVTTLFQLTEQSNQTDLSVAIEWAVECEYSTSLEQFAADFGKLICVRSKKQLYLNGINQTTPDGRTKYIERRLVTAAGALEPVADLMSNFYFGFWPSPEKPKPASRHRDESSLWEVEELSDLLSSVQLYRYSAGERRFIPIQEKAI